MVLVAATLTNYRIIDKQVSLCYYLRLQEKVTCLRAVACQMYFCPQCVVKSNAAVIQIAKLYTNMVRLTCDRLIFRR